MAQNLESNKIFAAILVAGIVAMLAGLTAELLTKTHPPEKDAVEIEGIADSGGGAAATVAMPEPILAMIATADVARGQQLSKACAACHGFEKGSAAKVGPSLWNTVNLKVGGHDFSYSEALAKHGGIWSYAELNKFLWSPKKYAPGTKMSYIGIKKPEDRAAVIAWLRTLSDSPAPLPTEAEIAKEMAELVPPAAAAPAAPADAAAPAAADAAAATPAAAATEAPKPEGH